MFGKEPDNQSVPSGQTSIIAQGCKFDGKVEVRGTLRVEGEFKIAERMARGQSDNDFCWVSLK